MDSSFTFLVNGSQAGIECWYGCSKISDSRCLESSLRGTFPDVRFHSDRTPKIPHLSHAAILTGTPAVPTTDKSHIESTDQIELLCRGLSGSRWIYFVNVIPIPSVETITSINATAKQIRELHSTVLLKHAASDEKNRLATLLVDNLEKQLKRFIHGRNSGMWENHIVLMTENELTLRRGMSLLVNAFSGGNAAPEPIRVRPCNKNIRRAYESSPLNSQELSFLMRPPIEDYPGYQIIENIRFGLEAPATDNLKSDIILGDIVDRGQKIGRPFSIPVRDLTKHGLIVGVTGSGKTNTCFSLLSQVWKSGRGSPFLVIESAKSEYRSLIKDPQFKGLHIFTVGDETTSPIRLNPFEVPNGAMIQTHVDYLKSLFSAAFVLYPPMPYVLEQSIQEIYEDRGWDFARNLNIRGEKSIHRFPSLTDLYEKIPIVVDRLGYDDRISMDVKAGLLARINQLRMGGKGLMLDTRQSIPIEILFRTPTILELKQIVSDDEKAFLIGLLLIRMYEYYESSPNSQNDTLVHLTLIEEAHRLLRNVSTEQGNDVTANPQGKAIEVFANILSEIRAYGEGIVIAEQIPSKLTPDAVKNTNLKIIHRLVAEDDRKLVGSTVNLSEEQIRSLSTLERGVGVAYSEGMRKPALIEIPLSEIKHRSYEVTSSDIREWMKSFWIDHADLLFPYAGCKFCSSAQKGQSCQSQMIRSKDPFCTEAAIKLFNAMRLNKTLVVDAYLDYAALIQKDLSYQSISCALLASFENSVEDRGAFNNWAFDDIETLLNSSSQVLLGLVEELGVLGRKGVINKFSKQLTVFVTRCKRLHKADKLPYSGCNCCTEPCEYRFDMTLPPQSKAVRNFRDIFLNEDMDILENAKFAYRQLTFFSIITMSVHFVVLLYALVSNSSTSWG